MRLNKISSGALIVFACLLGSASAQTPKFEQSFTDWNLYTFDGDRGLICYIASEPTKQKGNYTRRGPAAVLVAKLPLENREESEQVSVQPGYSYLPDSRVEISIDKKTFSLFTSDEHAWAQTSSEDRDLINSMKRGSEMDVRGTSTKKTYSIDTYSLLGFTAAYNAMRRTCGE